ncbi:DoxX family protein [Dictyobacter arantiisoli]|uniref:DoxX family protein n=1 Tax=Dictyobacter arantiisoli TaxID=2014874 RepID=A0A5A5T679_9CHLR|nr:DoxX family protein [Dictyobacter arantiisoli]GCF06960.1 hypothetical protein KDI_05240 [Dictyobacter arantiisoli]
MRSLHDVQPRAATQIGEAPLASFIFADTRMAWFWLIVRLYVGYEWLSAGLEKMVGPNRWVFSGHDGAAMAGFAKGALKLSAGPHAAVQGWYATILQSVVIPAAPAFAYIVTFGEVLVGLGLIFGILTGIAAFFGVFMNLNYMLAGTVSINPVIGVLAMFLILAWRIAGYWGGDRWILPLLGTPWTGSLLKQRKNEEHKTTGEAQSL